MMTQEQREVMASFVAEVETGYPEDFADFIDNEFVETRDPLTAFDGSQWAECEQSDDVTEFQGRAARYFPVVQVAPGKPRVRLMVLDFGEFRAAYTI